MVNTDEHKVFGGVPNTTFADLHSESIVGTLN